MDQVEMTSQYNDSLSILNVYNFDECLWSSETLSIVSHLSTIHGARNGQEFTFVWELEA